MFFAALLMLTALAITGVAGYFSILGLMAIFPASPIAVAVMGGVLEVAKLITASLMAAPGALVIAKMVYPETEESQTMGKVKLEVKSQYSNLIDAISHGASDGNDRTATPRTTRRGAPQCRQPALATGDRPL